MKVVFAGLTAAATMLAAPTMAIDDPAQLVRSLYQLQTIPLKNGEIDRYFSRDLASAVKRDIAPKNEVGETNGGDYRYNAQEFQVTELAFVRTTNQLGGNIKVSFKNFGKPETVIYNMCLARRGWRISNVQPTGWDMREALKLPTAPIIC